MYKATFNKISREVFNEVADEVAKIREVSVGVTVEYTGSGSYGELTIEAYGGHETEFKKALRTFTNAYL